MNFQGVGIGLGWWSGPPALIWFRLCWVHAIFFYCIYYFVSHWFMIHPFRSYMTVEIISMRLYGEDNPRAFREWIIARTDAKTFNNLLIAPACICTLCIARYMCFNIKLEYQQKGQYIFKLKLYMKGNFAELCSFWSVSLLLMKYPFTGYQYKNQLYIYTVVILIRQFVSRHPLRC